MPQKDKITIICPNKYFTNAWKKALKKAAPGFEVQAYPDDTNRDEVEFIMAFNPPKGVFNRYSNLKVVASMGAGVQSILKNESLPENTKVTKIVDPKHQRDIADFVLALIFSKMKNLMQYTQQKYQKIWKPHSYQRPQEVNVGIMGLGAIGQVIARQLLKNDFNVSGWSRSLKNIKGVESFYGEDQKSDFLKTAQVLVCVLPLTSETKGILNTQTFKQLPKDAYVINIGRGSQLIDEDLIQAIDSGQLSGAALDVFQQEPLLEDHPFWQHDKIMITPHNAGNTHPETAVKTVLKNFERMRSGENLIDEVNLQKGY